MWNGDIFGRQAFRTGDFAAAAAVAHEFGHHIQDELETQLDLPPIQAVDGLNTIGDAQAGGADPHGTPEQRSEAFLVGYNSGTPANCINSYWPGVTA